jgi:chloride channel 7
LIEASFIQYKCSEDEYNPLATLLLNTEGTVIKALLNKLARFDYAPLAIYFVIWYIFTVITYGTMVPAGLFLPGILIGCALGRMVGLFIENTIIREIKPSTYAIIGSASVLAGYTRLSFSLAVIMLETTENVGLFLPIIFALFISFGVGRIFNRSIYIGSIRNKNIPFLVSDVPESNKGVTAGQLMTSGPLVSLGEVATVAQIYEALTKAEVNSYPVVGATGRLLGLITRHNLTILLRKRCWITMEEPAAELRLREGRASNQEESDEGTTESRPGSEEKIVPNKGGMGAYHHLPEER